MLAIGILLCVPLKCSEQMEKLLCELEQMPDICTSNESTDKIIKLDLNFFVVYTLSGGWG